MGTRSCVHLTAVLVFAACATPRHTPATLEPLPMALCAGWKGERVCELLREDAELRVLRCTFAPGVGHEPHYHPPHVGYVLEGESVMRITTTKGVREVPVRAGTTFSNEEETRHAALNVGTQTTRYLIVEKKTADRRARDAIGPGLCAPEVTPEMKPQFDEYHRLLDWFVQHPNCTVSLQTGC